MHNSDTGTEKEYKIEDLPGFFKQRSKEVGSIFSNEVVEVSIIRSRSIASDTQEFSFKLRLTAADEDISNAVLSQMKHLISFFEIYLSQEGSLKVNIKVPKKSKELYDNYYEIDNCKTVEEFLSNTPIKILLQGIKITLQTDVKNINLNGLQQIESFLNEKLKLTERTENREQSQSVLQVKEAKNKDEQEQNKTEQNVASKESFGYNLASSKEQGTRAPVIVAAIRENVSWLKSFFRLPDSDKTKFFFQKLPELFTREQKAVTYHHQKCAENGQATRSHTEYLKANRTKSRKRVQELSEEEKQFAVKQALCDTRAAMIDHLAKHQGKRLDEIFVEVMSGYKNQDPETFHNIFNSTFNIVYFQDKQLHEVLELGEISEVLEVLEVSHPAGKSSFSKEYIQKQICRKKEQLFKLISGFSVQSSSQHKNVSHEILSNKSINPLPAINKAQTPLPANITLKSPLRTVFSSKETYFCLFLIASSVSVLCLWHLPLGKASILKELVPIEKRESIELALNVGLPVLIALCILGLAYFICSEYSVKSIEQASRNGLLSRAQ
ncbi:hypothetical protein [Wolbachia endosymbiont of Ctenocephalides felis wCfeJ]|uniref:hypothetical protein n=1 Tax=Wolbachia endosymbiont of Ctenocephalides felis wCfeJ TaxID=2732594 RepID=UPI001445E4CF|nr:hypothetical protein [Wolbachia endosymbiont of Ctenocephalides felis wCfeJ]WCR57597.1 MAG: hypothetical protein PG980_000069 [Wolbachia endosymbiont of Ctenocephalides felis wCfeJ]